MKKSKIMFGIWGVIVVVVVVLLTVLGFMLKNINNDYRKLEDKFIKEAEKYTSNETYYPDENRDIKITKKELMGKGYLKDDLVKDGDTCDGYVIAKLDGIIKYSAYIKCDKYTTKGY